MSRIEDAMEKARRLREEAASIEKTEAESRTFSLLQKPAEHIEVSSPRLFAANNYNLPIAEEYRKLKSVIVRLMDRKQMHNTLMVTSCVGGEGKSVTSLNLALSLAQDYDNRAVLVDMDLRNPSMDHYLGLKSRAGLTDCLLGEADLDDVLVNTGLGNLLVLPAGKKVDNPVELLASGKMTEFFDRMKRLFAGYYIIFDISPVLPFAEARIVGNVVDGIIFVVKERGTSPKNIRDALETLKGCNILGMVYNKATPIGLEGGYHYYYYDYDYRPRDLDPREPETKAGVLSRFLHRRARG